MSQFTVQPSFWKIFPDVKIAVITVHNLDNHDKDKCRRNCWQKPMIG